MQQRFNDGRYWQRMLDGEFTEVIIGTHAVAYPEILERHPDAESVTAHYRDYDGNTIAEVHYYRSQGGSILPGMRPDPKLLFEDGVMHHQEKRKARIARLIAMGMTKEEAESS
jgi:hypothetical protein